jgi:hypothetical protein
MNLIVVGDDASYSLLNAVQNKLAQQVWQSKSDFKAATVGHEIRCVQRLDIYRHRTNLVII